MRGKCCERTGRMVVVAEFCCRVCACAPACAAFYWNGLDIVLVVGTTECGN